MSKRDEKEPQLIYPVPPKVWMGEGYAMNTHALLRQTAAGKIINIGPSQPYKSPTGERKNQPYKYADVTGTPFDMYLNIIPGMHPFQWDLASMIITAGAPILGAIDGVIDDAYVKHEVDEKYKKIIEEGANYWNINNQKAFQEAVENYGENLKREDEKDLKSYKEYLKRENEEYLKRKEEKRPTLIDSDFRGLYGDLSIPFEVKRPTTTGSSLRGLNGDRVIDKHCITTNKKDGYVV